MARSAVYMIGRSRNIPAAFLSGQRHHRSQGHIGHPPPEVKTAVKGHPARGLQRAGYATDPRYATKIAAIAGGPTIERAVSAVADAGSRLGQTFASTATAALGITRR